MIATALVVLGVAGEFWCGVEIASINGQLRTKTSELRSKSDELLTLVTEQAGGAAISAQRANDALGEAQKKLIGVEKQTGEVNEHLAATKTDLDTAKSQLDISHHKGRWRRAHGISELHSST
jgi:hypothetical protein